MMCFSCVDVVDRVSSVLLKLFSFECFVLLVNK